MRFLFFVVLFYFLSLHVFSQENSVELNADSIEIKLSLCKHDTDKVLFLNETANEIYAFNPIKGKQFAGRALEIAIRSNFLNGMARSNKILGIITFKQGDLSNALKYYFESLKIYEQNNDLKGMASLYNNIGLLYGSKQENDKAIVYHNKSLEIKKKLKDKAGIAASYNNIGIIYSSIKKLDSSKIYHEMALELRKEINDVSGQGTSYYNLANNFSDLGDKNKSLEYHFKALAIFKTVQDNFNSAFCMNEIAMNYMLVNKIEESKLYADSALRIAKDNGILEAEMEVYKTMYLVFEKTKDPVKELLYYKKFNDLRFKINSESQAAEIGKMETKFEYEGKIQLQKLEQQKKDELQESESQRQNVIIVSIALILCIVIAFSVFLFNRFKIIKRQKVLIEAQKWIVEEKAFEVQTKQKEILDSIHYAKRIQNTLLAHKTFVDEYLTNNFIFFKPKDIVSGDFYWATKKNNCFYLAVCDSTGHGVPGAFMSLLNINFLNEAINEKNIHAPNEIFDYVRERLIGSVSKDGQKDGFDGILMSFNLITHEIQYAAANNSPILISDGKIVEQESDRMPVGHGEKVDKFRLFKINAKKGDSLYLYTDGYADQFGGENLPAGKQGGKKFKYKQLNELLLENSLQPLAEQSEVLNRRFVDWMGDLEQVDDVLIIGLTI